MTADDRVKELVDAMTSVDLPVPPAIPTADPSAASVPWRCFYCDDVFTREQDAAQHFGSTRGSLAACQIKGHEHHLLAKIREQENQLHSYREDDNKIMLAMWAMEAEHADALRRAEENGYAKGLADGRIAEGTEASRTLWEAATKFCAELQEDSEGVPQPELSDLHRALDSYDAFEAAAGAA